jgi:hypothetical protein
MLRLSLVLAVMVATLATGSDLMAQRRAPLRNFARQIGIQWGAGYHFHNPGPITDYYSSWSETNQPIQNTPTNANTTIGEDGYFDAGDQAPVYQNQFQNTIQSPNQIQNQNQNSIIQPGHNPNAIPQNTGIQNNWNPSTGIYNPQSTGNPNYSNGQNFINPIQNPNIQPGNIHSTGIQQNNRWPNQTGIPGTIQQGTQPIFQSQPGINPSTNSTNWQPADRSFQINQQINRNLQPWHNSGHQVNDDITPSINGGTTARIKTGSPATIRNTGTPYDTQFENSRPFVPGSSK